MLLLEDRHGEAGLDNQDLGLTLLRAAQVNAQPTLTQPCCQSAAHVFACDPCCPMFCSSPIAHSWARSLLQRGTTLSRHVSVC